MSSTRPYVTLIAAGFALGAVLSLWPEPEPEPEPEPALAEAGPSADEHPHPITPERVEIQHRLQLVAALNDAVDRHDITSMRHLIERYRDADPEDENALRAGYERMADCLQYPGAASRANAQTYYDHERASTLRRYVRRTCLE
jgi:hypothetical protein